MVDHIIAKSLGDDPHASDDFTEPGLHIPNDDRAMPIGEGVGVELAEECVAQEMMGVEHEYRLAFGIGDNDPFLAGGIDLPQERIVRRTIELREHSIFGVPAGG